MSVAANLVLYDRDASRGRHPAHIRHPSESWDLPLHARATCHETPASAGVTREVEP